MLSLMTGESSRKPWKRIMAFSLAHLVNDAYIAFFAPLLPLLIARLELSLVMAGFLGTVVTASSSLLQPVFGHFVDRARRPLWIVVGPAMTVCAMTLVGATDAFWHLVVLLVIAGIGTALFHPMGATLTALSELKRRGLAMAVFTLGGTLGEAIAPVAVVAYVGAFGAACTPWLIIPALGPLAWIAITQVRRSSALSAPLQEGPRLRTLPPMLLLLWSSMVVRSVADATFYNFLAVLITSRGASMLAGGAAVSVFLLAGAIGGLVAGRAADRLGAKWVIIGGVTLATPCLILFLHGPSFLSLIFIAVAGLFSIATVPVGIVAAQRLLPGRMGLVSGLIMGLPWGIAGLALTPIGLFADLFGLVPVMTGVAVLPLISGALLLSYHEDTAL